MPVYSNFWVSKPEVITAAGLNAMEGVRYIEMHAAMPVFQAEIRKRFRSNPSGATVSAYVSMLLIQQAVAQTSGQNDSAALYAALLQQSEVRTPDGPLKIVDRVVQFPLAEKIIVNGSPRIEQDDALKS